MKEDDTLMHIFLNMTLFLKSRDSEKVASSKSSCSTVSVIQGQFPLLEGKKILPPPLGSQDLDSPPSSEIFSSVATFKT